MPVTKTYKSEDWKLWTYRPQLGSFVLDFSQLDGPDVLGNGTDGLVESNYDLASAIITAGGEMGSAVIYPISPETAEITVNVKEFTIDVINEFYVGTLVELRLKNASPYIGLQQTIMFRGYITSAFVDVLPGEDFSTISISAINESQAKLNTNVGITKNETDLKSQLIRNSAIDANIFMEIQDSLYNFKGTAKESKSLGEWLSDLALCDFMQMTDNTIPDFVTQPSLDPNTWQMYSVTNLYLKVNKSIAFSSGVLNSDSITDIKLDWSGANSPTSVTLTNYTDNSLIYQFGSVDSGAPGSFSYNSTVDLKDLTQMTEVGKQLLAMNKAFKPVQITTITAVNNQEVDFKETQVVGALTFAIIPMVPSNLYEVGDTITVDLPNLGVEDNDMIVTGRTIEITPDNWTTTYNLWKGFTN
jgi:hypothetical protein